jgi:hypothetical protein
MKKLSVFLILAIMSIAFAFQSCQKEENEPDPNTNGILPERFKVDIPNSLSGTANYKSTAVDTLQGNFIYLHLLSFIWIGEHAADLVGGVMLAIAVYDLDHPMSFTFTSNADNRVKRIDIIENATFEGQNWQYLLTITDIGDSFEETEHTAMQVYWNRNPIKGVAILNPYNIDRTTDPLMADAMYRVDYSETGEMGYTYHMIVTITGLPLQDPLVNPYSMSAMKMFVGRNGDVISVYGNSEHPNARFFTSDVGFDWSFVASAQHSLDIGVAEVGLPSNTMDSDDRYELLVENSIGNVFTQQIYEVWPWIDSTSVQTFLYNTQAPGFFNHTGFLQGGTSPGPEYNPLLNIIDGLTPYNPADIHEMEIGFGE